MPPSSDSSHFERGYGYTLGNSLRRMLLSSLRARRLGVPPGRRRARAPDHHRVVEDVHQIIQRLKQLTLVLAPDVDEAVLHIKHDKAGPCTRATSRRTAR